MYIWGNQWELDNFQFCTQPLITIEGANGKIMYNFTFHGGGGLVLWCLAVGVTDGAPYVSDVCEVLELHSHFAAS